MNTYRIISRHTSISEAVEVSGKYDLDSADQTLSIYLQDVQGYTEEAYVTEFGDIFFLNHAEDCLKLLTLFDPYMDRVEFSDFRFVHIVGDLIYISEPAVSRTARQSLIDHGILVSAR